MTVEREIATGKPEGTTQAWSEAIAAIKVLSDLRSLGYIVGSESAIEAFKDLGFADSQLTQSKWCSNQSDMLMKFLVKMTFAAKDDLNLTGDKSVTHG